MKRYGLLVLDADGRRVGTIDLRRVYRRPELVARRLKTLASAPAVERHRATVAGTEKDRAALRDAVSREKTVRDTTLDGNILTVEGSLAPTVLRAHAKTHRVRVAYRDPVPLKVAHTQSPGVWYVENDLVYVTRLLVHPKRLGLATDDVATRTFRAANDGTGSRMLLEALRVPGVINVIPNLRRGRMDVVGRNRGATWTALRAALARVRPR